MATYLGTRGAVRGDCPIAEQIAEVTALMTRAEYLVNWHGKQGDSPYVDEYACRALALRAVLRTLEERRGFETWCEGAAITLKRAADILCDLGTEEADEVYAQAYTALNLCPVEIPSPPAPEGT